MSRGHPSKRGHGWLSSPDAWAWSCVKLRRVLCEHLFVHVNVEFENLFCRGIVSTRLIGLWRYHTDRGSPSGGNPAHTHDSNAPTQLVLFAQTIQCVGRRAVHPGRRFVRRIDAPREFVQTSRRNQKEFLRTWKPHLTRKQPGAPATFCEPPPGLKSGCRQDKAVHAHSSMNLLLLFSAAGFL